MYQNKTLKQWITSSDVVQSYLNDGENLLWTGQPPRGFRLRAKDAFLIPFSILWCGFAVSWELMTLGILFKFGSRNSGSASPFSFIFPLFGIPFVLIGLYMLFGRFIVDAMKRKKTYYGITNERIIIIEGVSSQKVNSYMLNNLSSVTLTKVFFGASLSELFFVLSAMGRRPAKRIG